MSIEKKLVNYLKAGYPCLAILTEEENRAQADILAAANDTSKKVVTWSAAEGIVYLEDGSQREEYELESALRTLISAKLEETVIILRDVHQWLGLNNPVLARCLRDLIANAPSSGSCVVVLAPEFKPYSSIKKLVTIVEYSLPTENDLREIAKNTAASVKGKKVQDITNEAIKALSGLSTAEAENALALSIIETGEFTPSVIYREKIGAVKRSGLLEIVDPDPQGLDAIGGLESLKSWILKRKKAYSSSAEKYGLPSPKGVLLVGVPGTGKTLASKALGTALGIPTLRLDIGSLFNSLVGESEARAREALALAEAMSPCVVWCDEIDKGFAGTQGSGSGDSGTAKKVFGTFLTWMQEHKTPVFMVMTANQVDNLPSEFLRKGRFDEIFSLDLPHQIEREQIAKVVIKKYKRDPEKFDVAAIANATKDFTGSEIEACVVDAMVSAFDVEKEVDTKDILEAATNLIPLAKTMSEKIEAIRKWGDGRAKQASIPPQKATNGTTRKIKV